MGYILHMTEHSRWEAGGDIGADSLRTEGFVHASPDEGTLLAVANAFYRRAEEQMVALVVDSGMVGAEVRWEEPSPEPPPGADPDVLFPHVFGPIPRSAVVGVRYLRRDPWGRYTGVVRRSPTAEALDLLPHPEGGWYRQTWRSPVSSRPEGYPGPRHAATAIHFLLCPGEESRWHRVRSDELWVFNRGGPLRLVLGGTGERPEEERPLVLGPYVEAGENLQILVPAGTWQTARPLVGEEALVSCIVAPGFEFEDFEALPD
ncbi:cupin domain-containing protein [Nocardiopsis sp. RSe5-2]|uniref:Cupin domain-containing protein n=1 Tax=Nocardiopsis endophytica TaxID=3018445 RepID=A0ABT4U2V7_9ACTN|nr:cupin domain-containing protein [Nocardiopsis endophytica]MDA2811288.1 cupin domain-containing protein [Nocardiopsis endophytica]